MCDGRKQCKIIIYIDFDVEKYSVCLQMTISDVVEDINDKHMSPWGEVCQRDGILNTPLNPYIDQVCNWTFVIIYLTLGPMTPYTPILGISMNYWGQCGVAGIKWVLMGVSRN